MLFLWIVIYSVCVLRMFSLIVGIENKNIPTSLCWIINLFLLFGVYVLLVANRTGPDIINYYNNYVYRLEITQNRELIYNHLRLIANGLGISFFTFRNILVFLCGSFTLISLKRLGISIPILLFFYMPILLFMDSGQLRNALCLYILVYALFFLIEDKLNSILIFSGIIIILSQIHTAFLFYLILLLLKIKNEKIRTSILSFIFFATIIVILMTVLNNHRIPFFDEIKKIVLSSSDDRSLIYSTTAGLGFLYPLIIYTIMTVMFKYASNGFVGNFLERKYIEVINGLNVCSFIFFPFMMMNINFYRFTRNSYFLSLIGATLLLKQSSLSGLKKALIIISTTIVSFLWVVFEVVIYDTPENIIDPIFKNGVWFLDP